MIDRKTKIVIIDISFTNRKGRRNHAIYKHWLIIMLLNCWKQIFDEFLFWLFHDAIVFFTYFIIFLDGSHH